MSDLSFVRVCPHCLDHPPYVPGSLQCGECGAVRPARVVTVRWRGGSHKERTLALDALDLRLHSDRYSGSATALLEWVSERTWRVLEAGAESPLTYRTGPIVRGKRIATSSPGPFRSHVEDALKRGGLGVISEE